MLSNSQRAIALPFVAWLLVARGAAAADAPTRVMTLTEALAHARAHQPDVQLSRARLAAARAETDVPRAQWRPTLGVGAQLFGGTLNNTTASYTSTSALDIPRIGGTRSTSSLRASGLRPYVSSFVGLGAGQELFDFGRIAAQAAAADALVDVEKVRAEAVMLDLEADVKEAYYAVEAAKSVLGAAESAVARAKGHRDLAEAGVKSGMRAPIELTRADADLSRFELGLVRAKSGVALAQTVLASAVGADDASVDTAGAAPPPDDVPSLREGLRRAATRDPAVREAIARLRAQEAKTTAVAAETRPDVSLTATLSGRAGGAPPSSGDVPRGAGFLPYVPNWDVGVVLAWPFHDPVVTSRAKASEAREAVERAAVDVVQKEQVAAVQHAYASMDVARLALPALERSRDAALANEQQADARFKQGLGTSLELADAEAARTDAEIQVALGRFDVARARARLSRVIAEGL